MNLFELGGFVLPSGKTTYFKIECDALSEEDWSALAALAAPLLPPFGRVEGVPRGGLPFARALERYATSGGLLIADDVWVSGLSMRRHKGSREAFGIVAFARNPTDEWVTPLLQMNAAAEESTYNPRYQPE